MRKQKEKRKKDPPIQTRLPVLQRLSSIYVHYCPGVLAKSPLRSTIPYSFLCLTRPTTHSTICKFTTTGTVVSKYIVGSWVASFPPVEHGWMTAKRYWQCECVILRASPTCRNCHEWNTSYIIYAPQCPYAPDKCPINICNITCSSQVCLMHRLAL